MERRVHQHIDSIGDNLPGQIRVGFTQVDEEGRPKSKSMKVIERYSELGPEGKDLAMLLLRLGRGRLGH